MTKKTKTIAKAVADAKAERAAHIAEAKMSGATHVAPAKVHPADKIDPAVIAACTKFTASILMRNKHTRQEHATLAEARTAGIAMAKQVNGARSALIHAIDKAGRAHLVPADFQMTAAPSFAKLAEAAKAGAGIGTDVDPKPAFGAGAPPADAAKKGAAIRASLKADRAPAKGAKVRTDPDTAKALAAANATETKAAKGKAAKPAKVKAEKKPAGNGARKGSKAEIAYGMLTRKAGAKRADIVAACDGWGIDIRQFCERKGLKLRQDKEGVYFATPK